MTSREDIATAFRQYWQPTFAKKTHDASLLSTWLAEDATHHQGLCSAMRPLLSPTWEWKVRRRGVRRAVDLAGDSAPGPDGFPYAAWERLGPLAVDTLWGALKVLESDDGLDALTAAFPPDVD